MKTPSNDRTIRAWNDIARVARAHALVIAAGGGTMVLAMPDVQREAGLREKVLRMHQMEEGS